MSLIKTGTVRALANCSIILSLVACGGGDSSTSNSTETEAEIPALLAAAANNVSGAGDQPPVDSANPFPENVPASPSTIAPDTQTNESMPDAETISLQSPQSVSDLTLNANL